MTVYLILFFFLSSSVDVVAVIAVSLNKREKDETNVLKMYVETPKKEKQI